MIEVDGSRHSGSGTILRYSVALATLVGTSLHMKHIRSNRPKPGLRHQHLGALLACVRICGGRVEGAEIGSQEILYQPGPEVNPGGYVFDVGTAGSTTLLSFALIIPALFASGTCRFTVTGGLFQDFAPSAFYMRYCLLPLLGRMGGRVTVQVLRPGYVPQGQGQLSVEVQPLKGAMLPLRLLDQGTVDVIRGVSLASHLAEQRVAQRMARTCAGILEDAGLKPHIEVMQEDSAVQKGAALTVWAETETGALLGSTMAGKPGMPSEQIAQSVAEDFLHSVRSGAAVDRFLADQLIIFAALAEGATTYRIPEMTGHVRSNLWLVEEILGAETEVRGNVVSIRGIGFKPRKP